MLAGMDHITTEFDQKTWKHIDEDEKTFIDNKARHMLFERHQKKLLKPPVESRYNSEEPSYRYRNIPGQVNIAGYVGCKGFKELERCQNIETLVNQQIEKDIMYFNNNVYKEQIKKNKEKRTGQ